MGVPGATAAGASLAGTVSLHALLLPSALSSLSLLQVMFVDLDVHQGDGTVRATPF